MGYVILLLPTLLLWIFVNKILLRKIKAGFKKAVWLATLFILTGIEFAGLAYINAHPILEYDKTKISGETAEKLLNYVHSNPDSYRVENFAGFRLSDVTFKFKEAIFIINGDETQLCYSVQSVPFGENHWTFFVDELYYGDEILP